MVGMFAEIKAEGVIALRKVGPSIFTCVKNPNAPMPTELFAVAGIDQIVGLVRNLNAIGVTEQSREIVVVQIKRRPEVAKPQPDSWLHNRLSYKAASGILDLP